MLSDSRIATMLPVSDLQRARAFYEDLLGFKSMFENEAGQEVGYQTGGGGTFVIYRSGGRADGSFTQMSIMLSDFDAEVADLRDRGVTFMDYDMPGLKTVDGVATLGNDRAAWFKDPDGNTIAVTSAPHD